MPRNDISDWLIHFTKGPDADAAFRTLRTIMLERRLVGGIGGIRGGFRCVCFTEAPLRSMAEGFSNARGFAPYSSFGVMLKKETIYALSGRPVVYGSSNEFDELGAHQWRHVRYEPSSDPPIDFTWQREWRLRVEALPLNPATARIIVPDRATAQVLIDEHADEQEVLVQLYSQVMDPMLAEQYREQWPWRVVISNE